MGEALVDTVLDYPLWPDSYAYKIQSQNILMAFREYMPVQMPLFMMITACSADQPEMSSSVSSGEKTETSCPFFCFIV